MKTNILILAAGHTDIETHDGGYPLCLTELEGVALIERIVANTRNVKNAQFTFALREDDVERFHLDKVMQLLVPGAQVVRIAPGTRGSACTALLAACQFNPDHEVLVVSANELVDMDLAEVVAQFRENRLSAGALTFQSVHPRYSYVKLNDAGLVTEAAQQNPISHHATAGVFWFAKAGEFIEAIKAMIRKDASVKGNFYIAPAFNEIILKQGRVGVQRLGPKRYRPLKTERQVYQFEQGAA